MVLKPALPRRLPLAKSRSSPLSYRVFIITAFALLPGNFQVDMF